MKNRPKRSQMPITYYKKRHEIAERRLRVSELYGKGFHNSDISRELGVSESTVDQDIRFLIKDRAKRYRQSKITNLKSFMFSSEPLGDLFTIIREIHEEKGTPDFHILEEKAQTRRGLDSIGGKPFLDRLEELYEKPDINPSNFRQYEAIVANAYKTRKVTEFCALTPSEIRDVMQIDGTIHKLRDNLETLLKEASPDEVSILGDLVGDVLESIKSREQNPGIVGLSTGIPELDYKTAVFNFTTCDGGTIFYIDGKEEFIESVENSVVIFDGPTEHAGVTQKNSNIRCLLNMDFNEGTLNGRY